jgi:hypothetical protein
MVTMIVTIMIFEICCAFGFIDYFMHSLNMLLQVSSHRKILITIVTFEWFHLFMDCFDMSLKVSTLRETLIAVGTFEEAYPKNS